MSQFNKIVLIGRVNSDVQMKQLSSGSEVRTFTLTVTRTGAEGAPSGEDNFTVVCWDGIEEAATLQQGQTILVEGSIRNRNYENNSGQRVYVTEINARRVRLFDGQAAPVAVAANDAVIPILEEGPVKPDLGDFNEAIKAEDNSEKLVSNQELEHEDVPF